MSTRTANPSCPNDCSQSSHERPTARTPATPGEREADAWTRERIRARLAEQQGANPTVEFSFRLHDPEAFSPDQINERLGQTFRAPA